MPVNGKGKLNEGIEYQFKVITYAAACLSENENVEDYQLYTNENCAPGFDDIIAKIKYKSDPNYHVRLVQVKHSYRKFNFDKNMKHKLNDYRKFAEEIIKTKNDTFLKDVPVDNFEFWFFTNSYFAYTEEKPIMMRHEPDLLLKCDLQREDNYQTIFPFATPAGSSRLVPRDSSQYPDFFNKFHLLLRQPNIDKICLAITSLNGTIFNNDTVTRISTFVYDYLKRSSKQNNSLNMTKEVFETELMRICLSPFIATPKKCIEIDDELAQIWNSITLNFDVTVVDNDDLDMEPYLFGCFSKTIKYLSERRIDWNACIDNLNRLSSDFDKVLEHMQQNSIIYWIFPPDTIDSLLVEMWKCNYIPLVLRADCDLGLLEKYRHLNKKFIILDKNHIILNNLNKISTLELNCFTNVAEIHDEQMRNKLLSKISISLQGRHPTNLAKIVGSHRHLMEQLRCCQILHLAKKRKLFLNKSCMKGSHSMVFLIINNQYQGREIELNNVDTTKGINIIINCKFSQAEMYAGKIRGNRKFVSYSICYLQDAGDKYELVEGNLSKLTGFLLYENTAETYFESVGKVVPILGGTFEVEKHYYISRSLCRATIDEKTLDLLDRRIYIFTGDTDSLNPAIRSKCIEGAFDSIYPEIKDKLKTNRNVFIVGDENWLKFSLERHSLCQVHVRGGKLQLVRYKRCQNLTARISYEGDTFEEKEFFANTCKGAVVVSGDPGIGKSTLLTSLFKGGGADEYSLFCDLADYRHDIKNSDSDLYKDPLSFVSNKYMNSSAIISGKEIPIYNEFLRSLCVTYASEGKLILFVDSFDEISPIHKPDVLKFMEKILKIEIRIVIASRLIADSVLINNFEVQPIKVCSFNNGDVIKYFDDKNLPKDILKKIPNEVLGNPLYLTFLDTLNNENVLSFNNINMFNLCKRVIEERIRVYYSRQNSYYNPETRQRKGVLEIHKSLAMEAIFGRMTVTKNDTEYKDLVEQCCDGSIKLGIITRFSDDFPIFLHHTYGEYLAAEKLKEMSENGDHAFREIYKKTLNGNNIQVRRFFDAFACENLELHEAVLAEDFDKVDHLCVKKTECLDYIDKYDRSALHLAASYCSAETFVTDKSSKILENIAQYMKQKGCDLDIPDKLLGWKWFQYIEDNESLFEKARRLGLTVVLNASDSPYIISIDKPMKESNNC